MMGNWMGGTWMGGSFWAMSLVWLVYLAIAAFVVGVAFWLAYRLIVGGQKRKG